MIDFDKQYEEFLETWKKTSADLEREQDNFLKSFRKSTEETLKAMEQNKFSTSWSEVGIDAAKQYAETMKQCESTLKMFNSDSALSGIDTKGFIVCQLEPLRSHYVMLDHSMRQRYKCIKGQKGYEREIKELVSTIKIIDELYYKIDELIKSVKTNKPTQRKLEQKK